MGKGRLTRDKTAELQHKICGKSEDKSIGGVKQEDLHPIYQVLANLVGVHNALIIARELGGTNVYLPKLDVEHMRAIQDRNRKVVEEFDGCNHRELARKYKVTDITIREILKREQVVKRK